MLCTFLQHSDCSDAAGGSKRPTVALDLGWIFQFCLPSFRGITGALCDPTKEWPNTLCLVWEDDQGSLGNTRAAPQFLAIRNTPPCQKRPMWVDGAGVGEAGRWGRRGSACCPHSGPDRREVGIFVPGRKGSSPWLCLWGATSSGSCLPRTTSRAFPESGS